MPTREKSSARRVPLGADSAAPRGAESAALLVAATVAASAGSVVFAVPEQETVPREKGVGGVVARVVLCSLGDVGSPSSVARVSSEVCAQCLLSF